jgi:signal peptidase I
MNVFRLYRARKAKKEIRSRLRTALRWREDIASPALVEHARAALATLSAAPLSDESKLSAALAEGADAADALFPAPAHPRGRENTDMLVVALSLAMACRAYFLQPFKIPTGSMQPTLNGITAVPQQASGWLAKKPFSWMATALTGEYDKTVRARHAGRIDFDPASTSYVVAGERYPLTLSFLPDQYRIDEAHSLSLAAQPGDTVKAGDVLAHGRIRLGDHVFVNRVAYNFRKPSRGDIVVFDVAQIAPWALTAYRMDPGAFYIKRLAGLPGEKISFAEDGRLVADEKPVTAPYPFERLVAEEGYHGYVPRPGSLIPAAGSELQLGSGEFLPLGDNTYSSLDGRYFGGVPTKAIVGPAFCVYWPFGGHFGRIR